MTEMEQVRRDLRGNLPARVVRASPTVATRRPATAHLRPLPARPVATPPATGLRAWLAEHYVADQLLRVAAVLLTVLAVLAALLAGVALLVRWLLGQITGVFAGAGAGVVGLLVAVALLAAAFGARSRSGGGAHSGYGWHYGKCRH